VSLELSFHCLLQHFCEGGEGKEVVSLSRIHFKFSTIEHCLLCIVFSSAIVTAIAIVSVRAKLRMIKSASGRWRGVRANALCLLKHLVFNECPPSNLPPGGQSQCHSFRRELFMF